MHCQLPPSAETKIVRCIRGAIYDVALDLRKGSETFGRYFSIELSEENRTMVYIPKGFAHGLISLKDGAEILYLATEFYAPVEERGVRWNDPRFGIKWPIEPVVISSKDAGYADYDSSPIELPG